MTAAVRSRTGSFDPAAVALSAHDHACVIGHGRAGYTATLAQVLENCPPSDVLIAVGELDSSPAARAVRTGARTGRVVLLDPEAAYRELDSGTSAEASRRARTAFDAVVDLALAEGRRTVRVVADNTARLAGASAEARQRWWDWEHVTDAWQTTRPITGTCWFDADRLDPDDVVGVLRRHAVAHGADTAWRVFHRPDGHGGVAPSVALAGAVDVFDADDLGDVLTGLDAATDAPRPRRFDLADVTYLHHRAVDVLAGGAGATRPVRLVNTPLPVRRLIAASKAWPQLVVD